MINFNWVPPSFWLMPTMGKVCMAVIASLIVSPSAGYISSFLTWWVGCEIAQQEGTSNWNYVIWQCGIIEIWNCEIMEL